MSVKEYIKKYIVAAIGLFVMALGISFVVRAGLGSSPISSIPNVLFLKFPKLSLGTYVFCMNCVLIILQIIIMRRDFQPVQLLQIPLSIVFKYFTDFTYNITGFIPDSNYFLQLLSMFIGIMILALGVNLMVTANVIMNSGEAFVQAVVFKTHRDFGKTKVVFDTSLSIIAVVLSLIFFHKLDGVREGTVIAAVVTGLVVKLYGKFTHPLVGFFKK